jgi:hypothetical protein
VFEKITPESFNVLMSSGVLKKDNHERCVRIFYDTAKVIHYRQERLNKSQLKQSQITSALLLVDFYHATMFRFQSSGALSCNFGDCPEGKALTYFGNSVVGTVADLFGRKIEIEDSGLRSLYKETGTGKHEIDPENYEESRGKRLSWIRHVLTNTKSIYKAEGHAHGKFRRSYLYASIASIPSRVGTFDSYFIVVVSENPNGLLWFVTAYPIERHNGFLKRIEECAPYVRP